VAGAAPVYGAAESQARVAGTGMVVQAQVVQLQWQASTAGMCKTARRQVLRRQAAVETRQAGGNAAVQVAAVQKVRSRAGGQQAGRWRAGWQAGTGNAAGARQAVKVQAPPAVAAVQAGSKNRQAGGTRQVGSRRQAGHGSGTPRWWQ